MLAFRRPAASATGCATTLTTRLRVVADVLHADVDALAVQPFDAAHDRKRPRQGGIFAVGDQRTRRDPVVANICPWSRQPESLRSTSFMTGYVALPRAAAAARSCSHHRQPPPRLREPAERRDGDFFDLGHRRWGARPPLRSVAQRAQDLREAHDDLDRHRDRLALAAARDDRWFRRAGSLELAQQLELPAAQRRGLDVRRVLASRSAASSSCSARGSAPDRGRGSCRRIGQRTGKAASASRSTTNRCSVPRARSAPQARRLAPAG